jgi:hypothetical protein
MCSGASSVHERAGAAVAKNVYPLTDEEWGLRRFFVAIRTAR